MSLPPAPTSSTFHFITPVPSSRFTCANPSHLRQPAHLHPHPVAKRPIRSTPPSTQQEIPRQHLRTQYPSILYEKSETRPHSTPKLTVLPRQGFL
ncbi:hypothetical protein BDZ45DRAFT_273981 [Acephala macrosclerotiorum]|nr:hypothetical protein BDZ45DRAFT_273981 [Acephala macrosclerotiorum]